MTALHEHPYPMDPMERAAAEDAEGVIVIIGGPGTGKTHTLVARVAALLEAGARPGHIACLTVRSESAADLRLRLERHHRTRNHLDDILVGTIHECANYLLRHAGACILGMSADYSIWDHQQAVEAIHFVWPEHHDTKLTTREIRAALEWHWRNRSRWHLERPIPARERHWQDVAEVYAAEKRRQNALDAEDLVVMAIQVMDQDQAVSDRWRSTRSRHLLVDQAEEFTARQLRLLELMVGPTRSLTVATDPNQRIHEDNDNSLLEFLRLRYSGLCTHVLRLNQQGSQEMWTMAVTLNSQGNMTGLWADGQVCDGVEKGRSRLVEVQGALPDMDTHCLNELQALAARGIDWEDMAILYRRDGAVRRMRTQLAHRTIPYRVLGEAREGKPGDTRCVVAMLTCLLNPRDLGAVRIAATPGYPNKARLLKPRASLLLRRMAWEQGVDLIEAAERHVNTFEEEDREHLAYLVQVWRDLDHVLQDPSCDLRDLLLRAQALVQQTKALGLPRVEEPEMDRLWRLCEATPRLRLETLRMHLSRFLDLWSPALHPEGPGEDLGVTFSTIHAAKGKQWRIVFVLDVSDQTMPGRVGPHSSRLPWEHRLFYTAVTRATEALYLYYLADTGRGSRITPSRFLEPVSHLLAPENVGHRVPWTDTVRVEEERRRT